MYIEYDLATRRIVHAAPDAFAASSGGTVVAVSPAEPFDLLRVPSHYWWDGQMVQPWPTVQITAVASGWQSAVLATHPPPGWVAPTLMRYVAAGSGYATPVGTVLAGGLYPLATMCRVEITAVAGDAVPAVVAWGTGPAFPRWAWTPLDNRVWLTPIGPGSKAVLRAGALQLDQRDALAVITLALQSLFVTDIILTHTVVEHLVPVIEANVSGGLKMPPGDQQALRAWAQSVQPLLPAMMSLISGNAPVFNEAQRLAPMVTEALATYSTACLTLPGLEE